MGIFISVLLPAVIAFATNLIITPLILFLAHRYNWYDPLDHRKIHTQDVPRLGGVGIFLSFIISLIVLRLLSTVSGIHYTFIRPFVPFFPIIGAVLIIHLMGLIDDFRNLRAIFKFIIQVLAAVLVILGGFTIDSITIPFIWRNIQLGILSYPISILWIVGLANAVNLLDGMDGLAGGFAAIAALFMGIYGVILGQWLMVLLSFALFGGLLSFLVFNFPPARIFMGDSGSLFIGFVLAIIPVAANGNKDLHLELAPTITLCMLPVLDTAAAIFRRIMRRVPISTPDREHIHHKLLDLGFSQVKILIILYSASALLGIATLLWAYLNPNGAALLHIGVWLTGLFLLLLLNRKIKVRRSSSQNIAS